MDNNQWERLSAQGVFDYLNGKCRIIGNKKEWFAMKDKYIGKITIKMLKESNLMEMVKESKLELKLEFSNANMKKMLKKDWNEYEMKKLTTICDRGELNAPNSPEQILSNDNDGNVNENGKEIHKWNMDRWWESSDHTVTAQRRSQENILPKE